MAIVKQTLLTVLLTLAVFGLIRWADDFRVQAQSGSSPCDQVIVVNDASGQTQTLVSAIPGSVIYVCAYDISADTLATSLTWKNGAAAISGAELAVASGHYTAGNGIGILMNTATGSSLAITTAGGAVAGWVRVGQH